MWEEALTCCFRDAGWRDPRLITAAAPLSWRDSPVLSGLADVNPNIWDTKGNEKSEKTCLSSSKKKTEHGCPGNTVSSHFLSGLFRPCECEASGSVGDCSPLDGRCYCRTNVEGQSCSRWVQRSQRFPLSLSFALFVCERHHAVLLQLLWVLPPSDQR